MSSYVWDGNIVVRKFDGQTGEILWETPIATGGTNNSSGISADHMGNVYVAAYTSGALIGPNAGGFDAILVKFSDAGVLQWSRQFGTASTDYAFQVATDQFGNIYTSGQTAGSLGGPNAGDQDNFLAKHDAAGNLQWIRQFGNSGGDASSGSWVDPLGNVYRAMTTWGALGGAHVGDSDIVVVKYDPSGSLLWAAQLGTGGAEAASGGITGDDQGNIYIAGRTTGSLGAANAGDDDAVLIKLSPPAASANSSSLDFVEANAASTASSDTFSFSTMPAEKSKRIAENSVDQTAMSSSINLQASSLNLLVATASATTTSDVAVTSDSSGFATADTTAIDAAFATLENVGWPKTVAEIALEIC
jgi:hypothetical protein